VFEAAAVSGGEGGKVAVALVARGPVRVQRLGAMRLAMFPRRRLAGVDGPDRDLPASGNPADLRGKPPAVQILFQKGIDTVERAAAAGAGNEQMVPAGLDQERFCFRI